MFMQNKHPTYRLVAVFTSRNCTKSFDSLSIVIKIFWHEEKIWALMRLLSRKKCKYSLFSQVQRLAGGGAERGQGHCPGLPGGVQRDQPGGPLVQTNQVVGPRRSGVIWVSGAHLSSSDNTSDSESQQSVLRQVTKTGVSKNFTRWLVTSKAALAAQTLPRDDYIIFLSHTAL